MFSCFFWLGLILLFYAVEEDKFLYYFVSGIFIGLALVTRQLFGFVIFLVFLTYYFMEYKNIEIFKNKKFYITIVASLLVSFPWHFVMVLKYGKEFISSYFGIFGVYIFKKSTD